MAEPIIMRAIDRQSSRAKKNKNRRDTLDIPPFPESKRFLRRLLIPIMKFNELNEIAVKRYSKNTNRQSFCNMDTRIKNVSTCIVYMFHVYLVNFFERYFHNLKV